MKATSREHVQHTVGNCAWRICPDPHCERRPAGRDGKLSGGPALLARACQAASGDSLWNTRGLAHGTASRFCWRWRRGHLALKKGRKKTPANAWREAGRSASHCPTWLEQGVESTGLLVSMAERLAARDAGGIEQCICLAWTTSKPELKLRGEVKLPSSMESACRLRGHVAGNLHRSRIILNDSEKPPPPPRIGSATRPRFAAQPRSALHWFALPPVEGVSGVILPNLRQSERQIQEESELLSTLSNLQQTVCKTCGIAKLKGPQAHLPWAGSRSVAHERID